mgnify:CR=1 FL=1
MYYNIKSKPVKVAGKGKLVKLAYFTMLIVIALVFFYLYKMTDEKLGELVTIAVCKEDIRSGQALSPDLFEPKQISKLDFDNQNKITLEVDGELRTTTPYMRYEHIDYVTDKYASFYIPKGQPMLFQNIIEEKALKNPWITEIPDENEIITLKFDYLDVGGSMLMVGDRIRLRAVFQVDSETAKTMSESKLVKQIGSSYITDEYGSPIFETLPASEILFDEIIIADMMNRDGDSIFAIYSDLADIPVNLREKTIESTDFKQLTRPVSMLLSVSKSNATDISELKNLKDIKFEYSLLKRAEDVVIEQFLDIHRTIESIKPKKSE